jgi:hypothetical protein
MIFPAEVEFAYSMLPIRQTKCYGVEHGHPEALRLPNLTLWWQSPNRLGKMRARTVLDGNPEHFQMQYTAVSADTLNLRG